MIKLEPVRPPILLRRSWVIFFSDAEKPGLWRFVTRKGYRHVDAAAYFADTDRWVMIMPRRPRMLVEVKTPEEAGPLLAQLYNDCTAAVRFNGQEARNYAPIGGSCVGVIKALCGIRSRALLPGGLLRDLLAQGAEPINVDIRQARSPGGRPGSSETAGAGGGTREAGPHQGSAGAVAA